MLYHAIAVHVMPAWVLAFLAAQSLLLLQVKQKGGTVEQIVIADMAFDVLKNAWGKFESGELRK